MKFKKILLLYSMVLACLIASLPYFPVQALTLEQVATDSTSVDVYFHDDGANLTTLTKDNITATLDGNAVTVENFEKSQQRINYMFLLDISGSVPENHMAAAKQEILSIYGNLKENDLLSVITFGDEVHTIINGTETLEEAKSILDGVHCDNNYTHFYDAVDLMLKRLEGTSDMRNVAVVVSDGINTGDVNTSIDSLKSKLSGSGIAIYALAVDSANANAIRGFDNFIKLSGGQLFKFSPSNCNNVMQNLLLSVDTIWNIGIEVDPALATGQPQSLVINLGEHGTLEHQVVIEQLEIDDIAPTITEWTADTEKGTLALHFSEAMADLKNPEYYLIKNPNQETVPVTVLEYTENYVLLAIEGFGNTPGWKADFERLMDASPNRNVLEYETIVLTSETVDEPVEPSVPDEPDITIPPTTIPHKYLVAGIGAFLILLVLIIWLIRRARRKRKEAENEVAENVSEENEATQNVSIENETSENTTDENISSEAIVTEALDAKAVRRQKILAKSRRRAKSRSKIRARKRAAKEKLAEKEQAKTKRGLFRWFRKDTPDTETVYVEDSANPENNTSAHVEESFTGGVAMSRGSALPLGSVPMRDASKVSNSSDAEDGEVHVNESKHQKRRLFGLFGSRSVESTSTEETDNDLGVSVNSPLHGGHAPTRKEDPAAKHEAEYVTDKVSEHRRKPKAKRVRKNWFSWKKKEIPMVPETVEEDIATVETPESTDNPEDEISKATARKYIKPKKTWFKKKMVPTTQEIIPEKTIVEEESVDATEKVSDVVETTKVDADLATKVETKADKPNEKKSTTTIVGTSIKSGGFSISGISSDYRPSLFNISLKPDTSLKKVTTVKSDGPEVQQEETDETSKKDNTPISIGSSSRTSSKQKQIQFTFNGKNNKK